MSAYDAYLAREIERYTSEGPEPRESDYEDAREELGEDATDDEIEALANEIMAQRLEDSRRDAEEHAAESRRDDLERDYY